MSVQQFETILGKNGREKLIGWKSSLTSIFGPAFLSPPVKLNDAIAPILSRPNTECVSLILALVRGEEFHSKLSVSLTIEKIISALADSTLNRLTIFSLDKEIEKTIRERLLEIKDEWNSYCRLVRSKSEGSLNYQMNVLNVTMEKLFEAVTFQTICTNENWTRIDRKTTSGFRFLYLHTRTAAIISSTHCKDILLQIKRVTESRPRYDAYKQYVDSVTDQELVYVVNFGRFDKVRQMDQLYVKLEAMILDMAINNKRLERQVTFDAKENPHEPHLLVPLSEYTLSTEEYETSLVANLVERTYSHIVAVIDKSEDLIQKLALHDKPLADAIREWKTVAVNERKVHADIIHIRFGEAREARHRSAKQISMNNDKDIINKSTRIRLLLDRIDQTKVNLLAKLKESSKKSRVGACNQKEIEAVGRYDERLKDIEATLLKIDAKEIGISKTDIPEKLLACMERLITDFQKAVGDPRLNKLDEDTGNAVREVLSALTEEHKQARPISAFETIFTVHKRVMILTRAYLVHIMLEVSFDRYTIENAKPASSSSSSSSPTRKRKQRQTEEKNVSKKTSQRKKKKGSPFLFLFHFDFITYNDCIQIFADVDRQSTDEDK